MFFDLRPVFSTEFAYYKFNVFSTQKCEKSSNEIHAQSTKLLSLIKKVLCAVSSISWKIRAIIWILMDFFLILFQNGNDFLKMEFHVEKMEKLKKKTEGRAQQIVRECKKIKKEKKEEEQIIEKVWKNQLMNWKSWENDGKWKNWSKKKVEKRMWNRKMRKIQVFERKLELNEIPILEAIWHHHSSHCEWKATSPLKWVPSLFREHFKQKLIFIRRNFRSFPEQIPSHIPYISIAKCTCTYEKVVHSNKLHVYFGNNVVGSANKNSIQFINSACTIMHCAHFSCCIHRKNRVTRPSVGLPANFLCYIRNFQWFFYGFHDVPL